MTGLLVKDFKLMATQKNFFLVILLIAIGMISFTEDVSFPLGFLTFVLSLFTLSTISYDEFDNGYAFLFTLPITRVGYVLEKYCLGFLLGFSSWLLATFLGLIATVVRDTTSLTEIWQIAAMILPVMIIIQSLMIPFQLKFGGEKGRIAIIAAVGLLVVAGVVIVKGAKLFFDVDLIAQLNTLPIVSIGMLFLVALVIAMLLLALSVRISISIMKKKQF
ncbi:ABC-2 transporter permease [Enterococcus gallinarum]|uniref:ABC-2 transporter permease n=1 Tax=Enterococcus gallinarum TaxID=1353 RepID=UPI001D17B485|nr:ABC-2 transporter permease [Enterococcus gallinarum]MCC4044537.1 ABC-2 transporter permease [Enterococcus gallinarum]